MATHRIMKHRRGHQRQRHVPFGNDCLKKNNLTLFIDPTATLFGSRSVSDYPTQTPPLSNSQTGNCQRALVYAQSCINVTVTGGGTINDVSNLVVIGPALTILPGTGNLVLQWNKGFTLQTATNVTGSFTDLTAAFSPYTNQIASGESQRFFRLRQ